MHCLEAIERFEKMDRDEMQKIILEIALLGRKGLKVNEPEHKYRLKSRKGEFNGLQLVSMMYVGFQMTAPDQDIGFDLAKEYEAANVIYKERWQGE